MDQVGEEKDKKSASYGCRGVKSCNPTHSQIIAIVGGGTSLSGGQKVGTATPRVVHHHPISSAKSANGYFKVAVVIRPLGHRHPMSCAHMLLSGAHVEMCSKAPMALFGLGAINRGGAWAWLRLSTLGMCFPCVCLV
jgi:hypothetical protein